MEIAVNKAVVDFYVNAEESHHEAPASSPALSKLEFWFYTELELPTTAGKEAVGVTRAVLPGESRAERHVSYSVTVQCFNLEVK